MKVLMLLGALAVPLLLVGTLSLWVGARWVNAPKATFRRLLAVVGGMTAASLAVAVIALSFCESRAAGGLLASCLATVMLVGVELAALLLIIQRFLGVSTGRAALVWLVSVMPTLLGVTLALLVVRPYVVHALVASTNSMAPTILGPHLTVPCPRCGGTVYLALPPQGQAKVQTWWGICGSCLAQESHPLPSSRILPADHVLVDTLATPRRWDMIAFRSPSDPSVTWVKRVVALPGEEVVLKDGAVWVNGARLTPPEPIARLEYAPLVGQRPGPLDSPDRPWRLKADEFCVLGDFTTNSHDSRMFGAVPRSSIEGVVTVLYWPPSRWHVWR